MSTADAGKGQQLTAAPINLQQRNQTQAAAGQNGNRNNQNQNNNQNTNTSKRKNKDKDYLREMKLLANEKANRNNPNNPHYKNKKFSNPNQNQKNHNQNSRNVNSNKHQNQNHNKNQNKNQNPHRNQNKKHHPNQNQNKQQKHGNSVQNQYKSKFQNKEQSNNNNTRETQQHPQNKPNSYGQNKTAQPPTSAALSLEQRIGVKRDQPDDETFAQHHNESGTHNDYDVHDKQVFDYIAQVGQGTYGKVFKAKNTLNGKLLAMKRLRIDNENEGFPVTAAREIKLLQSLRHSNIVKIAEMVVAKGDIYMALEYVEHDLAGILLNNDLVIEPGHAKSLAKQMFRALGFLHKKRILHRDIKGSNMLITANGIVKLADFGLARKLDLIEPNERLTNRVITMWYRPPELLLGSEYYGGEVDIWGLGCLLVEIFTRQPLFHGTDEVSQLQAIYRIMGAPSAEQWPEHRELPWVYLMDSMGPQRSMANATYQFDKVFVGPNVSSSCFDLASKLLRLNPSKRLTATEALDHIYFRERPYEKFLDLRTAQEWHDWEAKRRKKND